MTLDEAAALLEMNPQTLRNWVTRRVVTPDVRGRRGRGHSHQFSPEQVEAVKEILETKRFAKRHSNV